LIEKRWYNILVVSLKGGVAMKEDDKEVAVKSEVFEWVTSIAWAVVIALIIKTFIFNTTLVRGSSMYPTLEERDRLFAQKVTLYFKSPDRGQIIVLKAPDEENKDYIKRVVGVEGDTINIIDGEVYLNGDLLEENYIEPGSYTQTYDESMWEVGKDELFVLGDNREPGASKDSRIFGLIPVDSVKGIANFRYFPFDKGFGKLN